MSVVRVAGRGREQRRKGSEMVAKKKKASIKNTVQRGFATVSTAKKAVPVEAEEVSESDAGQAAEAQTNGNGGQDSAHALVPSEVSDAFDAEQAEVHQLQLLAERVKPAAYKDISRITKVSLFSVQACTVC